MTSGLQARAVGTKAALIEVVSWCFPKNPQKAFNNALFLGGKQPWRLDGARS